MSTLTDLPPELLDHILAYLLDREQEHIFLDTQKYVPMFHSEHTHLRWDLSRTCRRLRDHCWPTFLASTRFIFTSSPHRAEYRLQKTESVDQDILTSLPVIYAQLQHLYQLVPDPGLCLRRLQFALPRCTVFAFVRNGRVDGCSVDREGCATQALQVAMRAYALQEERVEWLLVVRFAFCIEGLVDQGCSLALEVAVEVMRQEWMSYEAVRVLR